MPYNGVFSTAKLHKGLKRTQISTLNRLLMNVLEKRLTNEYVIKNDCPER